MVDLLYLSIPASAVPEGNQPESDLQRWIKSKVGVKAMGTNPSHDAIASIGLPDLKIGTLDNLVVQSEEVSRIDGQLQGLVGKVDDIIKQLYSSSEEVARAEKIDNLDASHYLLQFGWNTAKYRPDKPIGQLLELLTQDAFNADQDLKARYNSYSAAKTNLAAATRKRDGDLTVRDLDSLLKKEDIVESEYLQTILVVVPSMLQKDFEKKYDTVSKMVVPASAKLIETERDHALYTVVVFKKYANEFTQKAREEKWVIRDLTFDEGSAQAAEDEYASSKTQLKKLEGDLMRLASAAYSDIIKAWGHVKVVRLFVESVLRYGLPPTFVTAAFIPSGSTEKAESVLIDMFGYLGGNAVGSKKDNTDLSEYGAVVEHDYKPFVIYALELP